MQILLVVVWIYEAFVTSVSLEGFFEEGFKLLEADNIYLL